MKLHKNASGKSVLKMTKKEWLAMGKEAGWSDEDWEKFRRERDEEDLNTMTCRIKKTRVDELRNKASQLYSGLSQGLDSLDNISDKLDKISRDKQRSYLGRGGDNQLSQFSDEMQPLMDGIGEAVRGATYFLQYEVKNLLDGMYTVAQEKKWREGKE